MEPNVAAEGVEWDSPKAEEGSKNEHTVISGDGVEWDSPKAEEGSKNERTVISGEWDGPKAEEGSKNEQTVISGDEGSFESCKNPVIVAAAEVGSMETPQETKNLKKKQKREVQVSNTKKPFIFYLNRAKRYINEFNEVELCGLGMAIPTVVTIAEILKRNGFAIQKGIMTSTVLSTQEDRKGRRVEKAKIEIVLGRGDAIDESC